tara:strand:+ start:374 stop:592 length:219 start_codon:yes stop_codon:yes gene_type:complete
MMHTRKLHWDLAECCVTVEVYIEAGTKDEPPLMEIERIVQDGAFPAKDIKHLFNLEAIEDLFWERRPDLGDY